MSIPNYVPQFDAPFRLDADGQVATVEQDSAPDVGAAIYDLVLCPQGAKLNDPEFGIPSPLFGALPLDLAGVVAAVRQQEPRAVTSAVQGDVIGGRVIQFETLLGGETVLAEGTILGGERSALGVDVLLTGEVTGL